MNLTRLWAHGPAAHDGIVDLMGASASTLGDSYCSLAWGARLAGEVGDARATVDWGHPTAQD